MSCYAAADGVNALSNISDTRILHRIDPLIYFNQTLPSLRPPESPNALQNGRHLKSNNKKRTYQLAFLLLVHGNEKVLQNIKKQVEILDDGSAIILIHIDARSDPRLRSSVERFIEDREKQLNEERAQRQLKSLGIDDKEEVAGNVFIAQNCYEVKWGHISIVWAQLNGFWELLDVADWELVINLSANDMPLRRSREIFRVLKEQKYRGKNFVDYFANDCWFFSSSHCC
jgi:hypothetical protein